VSLPLQEDRNLAFTPKTFEQILQDMVNWVRARSNLTDFNVGSLVRTILESAAMEDDELYFQMVQILNEFSIRSASGTELDRRGADFDESRLSANEAFGNLVVYDTALERSYLSVNAVAGAFQIIVSDDSVFSAIVPPFNIRLGEGTAEEEDVTVAAAWVPGTNIIDLDILTPLVNNHPLAAALLDEFTISASRVSYVSGAAARPVGSGTGATKPATGISAAQNFLFSANGSVDNGDFLSGSITAVSLQSGKNFNAPAQTIIQWTSAAPFAGAGVINLVSFGGGRDAETDDEFRDRLIAKIGSLSKGTVLAVNAASTGVEDEDTGQSVTRAALFEDLVNELVRVYVDDGSGAFIPDTSVYPLDALAAPAAFGAGALTLVDALAFPDAGWVLIDLGNTVGIEVLEYVSKLGNVLTLAGTVVLPAGHAGGIDVRQVELVEAATEVNERFFELDHIAVVEASLFLLHAAAASTFPAILVQDVDYLVNEGVGQAEVDPPLPANSSVFAYYTWFINLVEEVQRVLDGDLSNPTDYPGVRAAGVKLLVNAATSVNIDVVVSLDVAETANKADLIAEAEVALVGYISGLPVGGEVIRNEMIQRVMELSEDVIDLTMTLPLGNITVLENEVPVPNNIQVL
jgi:uncharacterized phage protein gp47/JayE